MFTFAAFCYMLSLVLCVSLIFFAIWHVSTSAWLLFDVTSWSYWMHALLYAQVWYLCVTVPHSPEPWAFIHSFQMHMLQLLQIFLADISFNMTGTPVSSALAPSFRRASIFSPNLSQFYPFSNLHSCWPNFICRKACHRYIKWPSFYIIYKI